MSVTWIAAHDDTAWKACLQAFPTADVYTDPGFARVAINDATTWLVVVKHEDAQLLVPLSVRALPAWLNAPEWSDAESPGYSSVLYTGDPAHAETCWNQLRDALSARKIVALFLRMNPFEVPDVVKPYLLAFEHPTVFIPLKNGLSAAFEGSTCATHRSKVKRARKHGYEPHITPQPDDDMLEAFRVLYNRTMDRLSATSDYYYPRSYFTSLRDALGDRLAIIHASHASAPGLHYATLMFRGPLHAHYHLGARRDDVDNTAGNLVFETAAQWAVSHGLAALHLGGGTTPSREDSLYEFKSRIAQGETSLRTAGIVADPHLQQHLIERWTARSGARPRWFLTWRQPFAQPAGTEVSV